MMKRVLFVASVTGHFRAFHLPYFEHFKKEGYLVEAASNGDMEIPFCDKRYGVVFQRSPLKIKNISAYRRLKNIIRDGNYDIIHCHTPVASMMTRIAARKARKKGTRVIYTAHGFHFYKGAPLLNWLIYFPVEWLCSFMTDVLITINKDDFAFAKKRLHAKNIYYVPGVGINLEKCREIDVDRSEKRKELGIPEGSTAVLSVGELNENKNHEAVLRAIAKLGRKDVVYVICGKGNKGEYLKELARQLNISEQLILAGYRRDVLEIYGCCDVFAFPSIREGLPVSLMEAMCNELPIMCSDIRGNRDLIDEGKGGELFDPKDLDSVFNALKKSLALKDKEALVKYNLEKIKEFGLDSVKNKMSEIYRI